MNSAAVEQEDHERWVDNLNIQERIFIIYNKRDFTLNGLRIFTPAGKQLGERVTGTLSEKATYLDFSEIVGHEFPTWNSHSFYIGEMPKEHPVIKDIYWQLFRGKNLDIDNNWQLERSELQNRIIIKESSKR